MDLVTQKRIKYVVLLHRLMLTMAVIHGDFVFTGYSRQIPPTILLIIKHPNYGGKNDKNHWVLTYGIVQCFDNNNKLVDKYFIVNDGYGKNDIRIHYTYQDDCVYI